MDAALQELSKFLAKKALAKKADSRVGALSECNLNDHMQNLQLHEMTQRS
jgi:hypothetical protein